VAVAVGVAAALGGFEEVVAPPGDAIPVAVGEEFNGGPWLVTIESAEIGYNLRGRTGLGEDRTLVLQVNARVEIVDDRTRSMYGLVSMLELRKGPSLAESSLTADFTEARSLRDNALVTELQPGLPERVAFLWDLDPETAVPDEVTVQVNALVRRYESWRFLGSVSEFPEALPAAVTVPLVDRTART
jgi:hypothetical protein